MPVNPVDMRSRAEQVRAQARRVVDQSKVLQARLSGNYGQLARLSSRETQVLRLLSLGLGAKEIAALLEISANTVNYHTASVYRKLGAHTRVRAVNAFRELLRDGLIGPAGDG